MGQEGKLELQPGVSTGVVEEADSLSLQEKDGDIRPGLGLSLRIPNSSILGDSLKGHPGCHPLGLRKGQRGLDAGTHSLLPLSIPFRPPLKVPPLKAHNFHDQVPG